MADDKGIEKAARSFAAARSKLKLPKVDKSRKATKQREKELIGKTDRRHLKRSGRTDLWGIRCRPGLKERCKAVARERGMLDSEWAEEIFEAAISEWTAKRGKGVQHG